MSAVIHNIACFSSGGPGNFATVLEFCEAHPRSARVAALVSDRHAIPAIELARDRGIEHRVFEFPTFRGDPLACASRVGTCNEILSYLEDVEDRKGSISLIVLAFRRILAGPIIERFVGRMINVHPADLSVFDLSTHRPRYAGIGGLRLSLLDGNGESRTSVHFVDGGVDTGALLCLGPMVRFFGCADSAADVQEHERRQKSESDRPALVRVLERMLLGGSSNVVPCELLNGP